METRTKKIEIKDIPANVKFEGYLWPSDQSKPKVLVDEIVDFEYFKQLPFIVEGNLWSEEQEISIQIRHIDGVYHLTQYDLKGVEEDYLLDDDVTYVAHDVGFKKYKVVEAWEEQHDELCDKMVSLVPAWTAFKGFSEPKK